MPSQADSVLTLVRALGRQPRPRRERLFRLMVSTESAALRLIGLRMLAAGGWPVATAMRGAQSETRLMEEAVDELYASLARTPTDDDRRSLWMALLRAWQSELADRYVRASGRRHALRHGEIDSAIQRAREALGGR